MSEWISVKERLPESKLGAWLKPVIALTDAGFTCELSCFRGEEGDYWQRTVGFIASGSNAVTHWMPLPEAPK